MKQLLSILMLTILASSCASIMNEKRTESTIYTSQPAKIVFNGDTLLTKKNRIKITADRKNKPIAVTFITDSLQKRIIISPINSPAYYANIFNNFGLGMFVDQKKDKRYGYPETIQVNVSDTISQYIKHREHQSYPSDLYLHLSTPFLNSFLLHPTGETQQSNTGFWGAAIGFDYYYQKKQYLNISASAITDFFIPFPAPVDFAGEHEFMTSFYISLSNNHHVGRFALGYGLSYAKNIWDLRNYGNLDDSPPSRSPVKKIQYAAGLLFSSYYQMGAFFNIGLIYKPSFWQPNSFPKLTYEHTISLDLAWKIRLNK